MRRSTRVVRTAVVLLAAAGLALEACDSDVEDLDSALQEQTETADAEPEVEEPEESEEPEETGPAEAGDAEADQAEEPEEPQSDTGLQEAAGQVDPEQACGSPATSGGIDPVPAADLPGQDSPMHFSQEGEWVSVVGVEHSDVLCVRELPDPGSGWVAHLPSFDEALLAGRERVIGSGDSTSRWVEVDFPTGYGWVNANFLAHTGGDGDDVTADLTVLGPHADIDALIADVAEAHAAQWPGVTPIVTRHLGGASGDAGPGGPIFYKLDFIGAQDDSVRGERLKFDVEQNADGYYVSLARSVSLCDRGVTADGLCV